MQKVVDALQEAMTLLHTDKETSIQTAKKIFPDLKYDVIKAAVDRMLERNMYPQSIVIDDAYWQRTLQTRIDSGDLKKPQTTDAAVDNTFAMRAQQDKK